MKEKPSSDPVRVAIDGLNRGDSVKWWVHEVFSLDSTKKVVIAASGDTSSCHSCGPQVALALVGRDSINAPWVFKAAARNLPVLSSWGYVPRFQLINLGSIAVLANTACYGNQGNEECTLSLFNLNYCNFGTRSYIHSYRSALDCTVSDSTARYYVPNLPQGIDQFGLTMHKSIAVQPVDFDAKALKLKTTFNQISIIHPTVDTLVWKVDRPLDSSLIKLYLCAWGPYEESLCRYKP